MGWRLVTGQPGIADQAIRLPTGGGALRGLGETFSPDLQTGSGNYSIPLSLPAGRHGFHPRLTLGYSTGHGNGPWGLGWSLGVGDIRLKTSRGVPRYVNDSYLLPGGEDLIRVAVGPSGTERYRPRTESAFARIDHHRRAGADYWEVRSRDGSVSTYGAASTTGADLAVIRDPDDPRRIFAWNLTRSADAFGNTITYRYERDEPAEDEARRWDQNYLTEIRYVDYGPSAAPNFLARVTLTYETRPDPFSSYRAGFEIRTRKRCTRIDVWTHADMDRRVRSYHLEYLDQRADAGGRLPANAVSLLSRVWVEGHDGSETERLPPIDLGYTRFEPERRTFEPFAGATRPPISLGHPDVALVDLFGQGLPDILEMNGSVRYWRNLGADGFALPRDMPRAPAGVRLADVGVQLVDANGDGRTDLLVTTSKEAGYFPLRFDGLWDDRSFHRYRVAPSFSLEDPSVRLIDLNGDGVTDAIRSGQRLECFFSDPARGWTETRWVERSTLHGYGDLDFSDSRVRWADMTGDGLQDLVLVWDGNVEYLPNLGWGEWAAPIHMANGPRLPFGYSPRRLLLGDVDGDGAADLVYVDDRRVTLWINQGGARWSDPIVIEGTPPLSDQDDVRLVDALGGGVSGVLWTTDAVAASAGRWHFLDFTGGTKPYLLQEIDNHLGARTRVAYVPSTRFCLDDERARATRWKTSLPFPVQVVARVETLDAISGGLATTEFRYHHGYWDGVEREFRGFGRVDQRDSETFAEYAAHALHPEQDVAPLDRRTFSPPTETRTWFHLGPVDEAGDWRELEYADEHWPGDPSILARPPTMEALLRRLPRSERRDALRALRGQVLRTELYVLDGSPRQDRPYTVTERLVGVREEAIPGEGEESRRRIFFPHLLGERVAHWERGAEPMTRFAFIDQYDAYGQPTLATAVAVPRGRDVTRAIPLTDPAPDPYLVTRTVTDYAQRDDTRYIVDRVSRTTIYEILNDGRDDLHALRRKAAGAAMGGAPIVAQTLTFYDGAPFTGLPFGTIGDHGAAVRTEQLVLTEQAMTLAYGATPPYLTVSGPPVWTPEYPQAFRDAVTPGTPTDPTRPGLAITPLGYGFAAGGTGSPYARGYFAATSRQRYDVQTAGASRRGLVLATRNPLGHETRVAYDPYDLMPRECTDPLSLTTSATYDYRVLQAREIIDPNGNATRYSFTPLGQVRSVAVLGKPGLAQGDSDATPGTTYAYDLHAFDNSDPAQRRPISVRTSRRVHHVGATNVPAPERDETIEMVEYSDGFGRLIQTRRQAEDVTFGDVVFGDAGLPLDPAANGDAVGVRLGTTTEPRVAVNGWQVFDNKGRPVAGYEPFFSRGWTYRTPALEEDDLGRSALGQRIEWRYDPLGRLTRTIGADGAEQRMIRGRPLDLGQPELVEPGPWDSHQYDGNDNAGRTHPVMSGAYAAHWNTPSTLEIDALGRTVRSVVRNGPAPGDWHTSRSTYDIRGNLLSVSDALGRVIASHVYDLTNRPLSVRGLDSGARRTVYDAAGNVVEVRDAKGALTLHAYDAGSRPIRQWARDGAGQPISLRQRLVYGDRPEAGLSAAQATTRNLRGRLYRHYDEAGLLTCHAYDFKGNPTEKSRRVVRDDRILAQLAAGAFRVDWQPSGGSSLASLAALLLDTREYQTTLTFDALGRTRTIRYPEDDTGARRLLEPRYNRAGALMSVRLAGTSYVEHVSYNARGQRTLLVYGNGVMTRFAYHPQTFRLARLRTERYTPGPDRYHPIGLPLQDQTFRYDLVGNILEVQDRTPGCGVAGNPGSALASDPALAALLATGDALLRTFTYDPLYRLTSATGRECQSMQSPRPWADSPTCGFGSAAHGTPNQANAPSLTQVYREEYAYDPAGNVVRLAHHAGAVGWTRHFGIGGMQPQAWATAWPPHVTAATLWPNPPANRLTHVGDNQPLAPSTHQYDANGNLTSETTSRRFAWDHADRLVAFRTQAGAGPPSVEARYLYDAGGQRVKKLVRKQGGRLEVAVYVDGVFEHHTLTVGATRYENTTLHVVDDKARIATVRVGNPFPNDSTPAVQYHLGDHLGSSSLVLDQSGAWVNREEYTPYGETVFGGFARKRYRFTGQERDEESGLTYHGARYYAPWLTRWTSCDPLGIRAGPNQYQYVSGNPIRLVDPRGAADAPPTPLEEQAGMSSAELHEQAGPPAPPKNPNAQPEQRHTPGPPPKVIGSATFLGAPSFIVDKPLPEVDLSQVKMPPWPEPPPPPRGFFDDPPIQPGVGERLGAPGAVVVAAAGAVVAGPTLLGAGRLTLGAIGKIPIQVWGGAAVLTMPFNIKSSDDVEGHALAANIAAFGIRGPSKGLQYRGLTTAEEAAMRFDEHVRQAEAFFQANPGLIPEWAEATEAQVFAAARKAGTGDWRFANLLAGRATENFVAATIRFHPEDAYLFQRVGGAGRIDFLGAGRFQGLSFELTTEAAADAHTYRLYLQQPGAMIFRYTPPF